MQSVESDAPPRGASTLRYGALTLNPSGFMVSVGDQDIPVTLTEFLLLTVLARRPYHVFDRPALAAAVKGHGVTHGVSAMSPRAVDLHISRLRKKLSQAGYDCIKTMRFVGYRFVPAQSG
jgi:DNA-binding response OmpR family regulator